MRVDDILHNASAEMRAVATVPSIDRVYRRSARRFVSRAAVVAAAVAVVIAGGTAALSNPPHPHGNAPVAADPSTDGTNQATRTWRELFASHWAALDDASKKSMVTQVVPTELPDGYRPVDGWGEYVKKQRGMAAMQVCVVTDDPHSTCNPSAADRILRTAQGADELTVAIKPLSADPDEVANALAAWKNVTFTSDLSQAAWLDGTAD